MSLDFSLSDLLSGFESANIGGGDIQEAGADFDIFESGPGSELPETLPEFDYDDQPLEFNENFDELENDLENIKPEDLEDSEVIFSPEK